MGNKHAIRIANPKHVDRSSSYIMFSLVIYFPLMSFISIHTFSQGLWHVFDNWFVRGHVLWMCCASMLYVHQTVSPLASHSPRAPWNCSAHQPFPCLNPPPPTHTHNRVSLDTFPSPLGIAYKSFWRGKNVWRPTVYMATRLPEALNFFVPLVNMEYIAYYALFGF